MRRSGILLHISSLPSDYGIGTMGDEAYKFVDFLRKAGQTYWQILPLGPTSYGDSPYQSPSVFAGNPYFIDFDILRRQGYLNIADYENENWGGDAGRVDYHALYLNRFKVLRKAFANARENLADKIELFKREQAFWLDDYALFMAIKDKYDGKPYGEWPKELILRDKTALDKTRAELAEELEFWVFVQYFFYKQWAMLKSYANGKGIYIIGDIPIYAAHDSADVWSNQKIFNLDADGVPVSVAGCPPDYFSEDGQLWGNPTYNWDALRRSRYGWWVERIRHSSGIYDIVRIDHFRGFDSYYAIPYGAKNARVGKWEQGPGYGLFRLLERKLGKVNIIAENLGFMTESVIEMHRKTGYPGMKIISFGFDPSGESEHLSYKYDFNEAVYIGTHDNDTLLGWFKSLTKEESFFVRQYMRIGRFQDFTWEFIKEVFKTTADTAIIQMQDYLRLGSEARMNTPSTLGGNFAWRMKKGAAGDVLAARMKAVTQLYGRIPKK
ncbi:MAG: 4-alpha-glucanotransferase [Oscillospiraceae bacterium]|jgi:4-alpha-glucanotransferase|nr:4-alpha-glucanotransferase [Oscillospiraceae bacterium]